MPPAKPYPGDAYILNLVRSIAIAKDADGNTILGKDTVFSAPSLNNVITADNVNIGKSHDNIISAKNLKIWGTNGARVNGADHEVGDLNHIQDRCADYCSVDGDAHKVKGYGSITSGTGNKNYCYSGRIHGQNSRIGMDNEPNKYRDSTIDGSNCEIDGNNSHAIGNFIKIQGDNITVIGNPPAGTVYTTPGVYTI